MTYNFHLPHKYTNLSFKSVCNKEPKALVLQDECFGKNYSSFLDFTRNYKRTSGIFVPLNLVALSKGELSGNLVIL